MRTLRILNAGLFLVLAGMMIACGNPFAKVREAAGRSQYMNDMKQIGMEMHNYHTMKGRMPKNANELIAASPALQGSTAASRLMNDEITMVWGFNLNDQSEQGQSLTLMGWSNDPVFKGNVGVIYCDGNVLQITPAEFATAKKPIFKTFDPSGKTPPPVPPTRPTTKKAR